MTMSTLLLKASLYHSAVKLLFGIGIGIPTLPTKQAHWNCTPRCPELIHTNCKLNYKVAWPLRYVPDGGMGNGVEDDKGQKLKGRKGSSPGQDLSERYSGSRGGKGAKRSGYLDTKPVQNPRSCSNS